MEAKRVAQAGDQVTVSHLTATRETVEESFTLGSRTVPESDPPSYGPDHPWAQKVLGKTIGDVIVLPTREENEVSATITQISAGL